MIKYLKLSQTLVSTLQVFQIQKFASLADLVGRHYLTPKDFSREEMQSVLWTAIDLKEQLLQNCSNVESIKSFRITLLMHKPTVEIQGSAMSAANLLKAHLNIIIDPLWDNPEFVNDVGRFFSTCSDMILCQSKHHSKIEKLAEGATIPVVCIKSSTYTILDNLADVMTLQEKYGYLKNLRLGWIGKPCPLINTYLCIAPKLGIDMQYCCACSPGVNMSPAALPLGKKVSENKHTSLRECDTATAAIEKVHVIVMSKYAINEFNLNLKHISERADKNWSFLHKMPRGTSEVTSEVFNHKNSLVWQAKGNLQWIYAALMVRLLTEYEHSSKKPEFDNVKCCP